MTYTKQDGHPEHSFNITPEKNIHFSWSDRYIGQMLQYFWAAHFKNVWCKLIKVGLYIYFSLNKCISPTADLYTMTFFYWQNDDNLITTCTNTGSD